MSTTVLKLFGVALLCVFAILLVKKGNPDGAVAMKMLFGVLIAVFCMTLITPIAEYIGELGESFDSDGSFSGSVEILLKSLGVAILTHICATVCRDSGEASVAGYVELGGKIEILLLSLPLLRELLNTALELLEM